MTQRTRINPSDSDLAGLRERIAGARGPKFWRSLEELSETEEFLHYLHREFPEQASEWHDPVGRRQFLRVMAASLVLAGVSGCVVQPTEHLVPYVESPEEVVPGEPLFFATASSLGGYATGLLVESDMGRPVKIEGNDEHPANLGGTDVFAQAETLMLYDPDRSTVVTRGGRVSTWEDFEASLIERRLRHVKDRGKGFYFLTETISSPTIARQMKAIFADVLPEARWIQYEPVGSQSRIEGATLAFGENVDTVAHLDKADVVLALDADFLSWGPGRLRYAREFARRREEGEEKGTMNRLYAVDACPTITGAMADHRWPVLASQVPAVALAVARELGVENLPEGEALEEDWIKPLAEDLKAHNGSSLVLVGDCQPAEVHALAHAINAKLGAVGKTVTYIDPVAAQPPEGRGGSLAELVEDMNAGKVESLMILGGNPVYDAPADLGFTPSLLRKVPFRVHLGLYLDETGMQCNWHVPQAHFLEGWGDVRAYDGTASIVQPLIRPLHQGRTIVSVLSILVDGSQRIDREVVRETWSNDQTGEEADRAWRKILHDGFVADSGFKPREAPALKSLGGLTWPEAAESGDRNFELVFRPDPTIWDGRYANNGWLQELPKPLSRLTWDNAALINPEDAAQYKVEDGEVLELDYKGRKLRVPALRLPGQARGSIGLHLGYGRHRNFRGRIAEGAGVNAYYLRTWDAPWQSLGLDFKKTGATYELATVQMHHNMAGRDLVRMASLSTFKENPRFAEEPEEATGHGPPPPELTIFEHPEPMKKRDEGYGNKWGMAINLNTCIGCAACVVACQAENNFPVVGKTQVLAGREMHWIRIDRYYQTDEDKRDERIPIRPRSAAENPRTFFQPVPCQHCENAPCELVCPVGATTHSAEGINEMTYNRCVGTRYCSNNCPYKVRRFNFLHYADIKDPLLKMVQNPDVTVRFRGVMEKCTYCIQRINNGRIASEIRGEERVPGNMIRTACQGACPTRAITFGNLNDPGAEVVKAKASPRNYAILAETNARPRTTYLARLSNPNAVLSPPEPEAPSSETGEEELKESEALHG